MSYNQTKNTAEEIEILNADDEKLRQMLGGLKKVNAPANFDFKLKARIANAEPSNSPRPFLFPALRYVLPLGVIVLLAGFVIFNLSFTNGNQVNEVAETTPKIQNKTESVPNQIISQLPANESAVAAAPVNKNSETKPSDSEIAVSINRTPANKPNIINVKNAPNVRNIKSDGDSKIGFRGSQDRTQKEGKVITQNNSARNLSVTNLPITSQNKISLQGILSEIGIEASFDEKNWKILSIKENSLAMRAGLQAGDLIEAIDDKKLSSDTVFLQKFSGKIFRIMREGKQMVIDLTAKQ